MSGIDWQHFLTYEVRYQLIGFCGVITLNRIYEDLECNCSKNEFFLATLYSIIENYRLVMLVIDGIETKKIETACSETTGIPKFKQLFNKMERLNLEFDVLSQIQGYNSCGLSENIKYTIADIHRCNLDCYIYPVNTVLWLSSIPKGRELLPPSLLNFLEQEIEQESVPTIRQPAQFILTDHCPKSSITPENPHITTEEAVKGHCNKNTNSVHLTPEVYVQELMEQGVVDAYELAKRVDKQFTDEFHLSDAKLGILLPARSGTEVGYQAKRDRGRRLRGKK